VSSSQLDNSQHAGLSDTGVDMHLHPVPLHPDPEAKELSSRTSSSAIIWEFA